MTAANYADFGKFAESYKGKDFYMLLFPCNQFLSQEPKQPTPTLTRRLSKDSLSIEGAHSDIAGLMSMVNVNGKDASPVYDFLKYNSSLYSEGKGEASPIPWNFAKFLVDPNGGGVFGYYSPKDPLAKVTADIDLLLSGQAPPSQARAPTVAPPTAT